MSRNDPKMNKIANSKYGDKVIIFNCYLVYI